MGLDDEELPFEEPQTTLPDRQRKAIVTMVEGLGDDLPIDPDDPVGAADFVAGDPGDTLEQRHAGGGSRPWVTSRDSTVAEGRITAMSPRAGGRRSTR